MVGYKSKGVTHQVTEKSDFTATSVNIALGTNSDFQGTFTIYKRGPVGMFRSASLKTAKALTSGTTYTIGAVPEDYQPIAGLYIPEQNGRGQFIYANGVMSFIATANLGAGTGLGGIRTFVLQNSGGGRLKAFSLKRLSLLRRYWHDSVQEQRNHQTVGRNKRCTKEPSCSKFSHKSCKYMGGPKCGFSTITFYIYRRLRNAVRIESKRPTFDKKKGAWCKYNNTYKGIPVNGLGVTA